jgi:hypothetical protein
LYPATFVPVEAFQARFTVSAKAEGSGMAYRKKKSGIRMVLFRISVAK